MQTEKKILKNLTLQAKIILKLGYVLKEIKGKAIPVTGREGP
jgi:hypothetical protein